MFCSKNVLSFDGLQVEYRAKCRLFYYYKRHYLVRNQEERIKKDHLANNFLEKNFENVFDGTND